MARTESRSWAATRSMEMTSWRLRSARGMTTANSGRACSQEGEAKGSAQMDAVDTTESWEAVRAAKKAAAEVMLPGTVAKRLQRQQQLEPREACSRHTCKAFRGCARSRSGSSGGGSGTDTP